MEQTNQFLCYPESMIYQILYRLINETSRVGSTTVFIAMFLKTSRLKP